MKSSQEDCLVAVLYVLYVYVCHFTTFPLQNPKKTLKKTEKSKFLDRELSLGKNGVHIRNQHTFLPLCAQF